MPSNHFIYKFYQLYIHIYSLVLRIFVVYLFLQTICYVSCVHIEEKKVSRRFVKTNILICICPCIIVRWQKLILEANSIN